MVVKINTELSTHTPIVYRDAEKLKPTPLSSGSLSQHSALPSHSLSFPGEEVESSEALDVKDFEGVLGEYGIKYGSLGCVMWR